MSVSLTEHVGGAPGFCRYQPAKVPKLLFNVLKAGPSLDFSFWSLFLTMIEQVERHLLGKLRKKTRGKARQMCQGSCLLA